MHDYLPSISKYEWYNNIQDILYLKVKLFSGDTCSFNRENNYYFRSQSHGHLREFIPTCYINIDTLCNIVKRLLNLNMQVVELKGYDGKIHRYKYKKDELSGYKLSLTKNNWMNHLDKLKHITVTLGGNSDFVLYWSRGGWRDVNGVPVCLSNQTLKKMTKACLVETNGKVHIFEYNN